MGLRAASFGTLRLEGVRVGKESLLGGDAARAVIADAVDRSRIAWSALAVGTSQAVLDYVVPYTNDRQAFGEPISSKQSVAFMVADIAIELEGMRLLVYRAASRVDAKASFKRESFLARLFAAEKGMQIGSNGIQLLGGHGFIREYPVERWYRHLRGLGMVEGGIVV
jgi:alkylation response protein AidB-like acyl-CoA dehydrogenase